MNSTGDDYVQADSDRAEIEEEARQAALAEVARVEAEAKRAEDALAAAELRAKLAEDGELIHAFDE